MMSGFTRAKLVDYLLEEARWREQKAAEYPDDARNAASATALVSAAREIKSWSHDDPRFAQLETIQSPYALDVFSPSEESRRLVSRYGFGRGSWSAAALVEQVLDAEIRASVESVDDETRWHGLVDEGEG